MSLQTFVNNRQKIQFANLLPFGKIVGQSIGTITVNASSTTQLTLNHTLKTTPSPFGWARIQSDGRWIPMLTTDEFTGDEFGAVSKQVFIKPFGTATTYGVYVKNVNAGSAYTIDVKIWLLII